ncbi:MAG: glycosyl hydrolase family 28 protein [Bryobacteraceae bacterium]|jgi:polygalacturonase
MKQKLMRAFVFLLLAGTAAFGSDRTCNVRQYGAVGNGKTLDSPSINKAIEECQKNGGGTVEFPAGTYLSGSVRLRSNVNLHLSKGATILGAPNNIDAYDHAEPNPNEAWQDFGYNHVRTSLIWGDGIDNVSLSGPGVIDGSSLARGLKASDPAGGADKAIGLRSCRNIRLSDFTVNQGGHFGILMTGCDGVQIGNVTVRTSRDGIDIVGSRNVEVYGVDVESIRYENGVAKGGDDAIVLKSNRSLGRRLLSENIVIRDSKVATNSYGIHFGSETAGDFRNIQFRNIVIEHADKAGISITSNDGAVIDNVTYENIRMSKVAQPIYIKLSNRQGRTPETPTALGRIRNVTLKNITATDVYGYIKNEQWTSTIMGKPGVPVENITLENVRLTYKGGGTEAEAAVVPPENDSFRAVDLGVRPSYGFYCRNVKGLKFRNVEVSFEKEDRRPALVIDDAEDILLEGFTAQRAPGASFDGLLRRVKGLSVIQSPGLTIRNESVAKGERD